MKNIRACILIPLLLISIIMLPISNTISFAEEGEQETIIGTDDSELLLGEDGEDNTIDGGAGDDIIIGGTGDDTINGGEGDDIIDGDAGDDTIYGDEGNDIILGGSGNDTIDGGSGNDIISGGDGDDTIEGGSGDDVIYGDNIEDINEDVESSCGDEEASETTNNDTINGGDGDDEIYGQEGDDTIDGGAGNDFISGGPGDDIISGGDGDDIIFGGEGNDQIDGGEGNDTAGYDSSYDEDSVQIGRNEEGNVEIIVNEECSQDILTDIENLEFKDAEFKDVFYTNVKGFLSKLERNKDGTYTAYWGYENSNEFKAFEKQYNYFLGKTGLEEYDNRDMIFEKGEHEASITTTVKDLIQKWVLGDDEIVADATELEKAFLKELGGSSGSRDSRERMSELERFLALIKRLKRQNILKDNEYTIEYLQENITVGELAEVLERVTDFNSEKIIEIGYDENEYVTKENVAVIVLTAFKLAPERNAELYYEDADEIRDFAKGYVSRDLKYRENPSYRPEKFNPSKKISRLEAYKRVSFYLDFLRRYDIK